MPFLNKDQIKLLHQKAKTKQISLLSGDTETPIELAAVWSTGEQYIGIDQIVTIDPARFICSQFYYAGDKKATALVWKNKKDGTHDDKELVRETVRRYNEADILLGQNIRNFDIKKLNDQALYYNLPHVEPKFIIDILPLIRKTTKGLSNKLDYRSTRLGFGGKHKMERDDWIGICLRGVSPYKKMVPYGLKDTVDTMKVFWRELPYYNFSKKDYLYILKLIGWIQTNTCLDCKKRRQKRHNVGYNKKLKRLQCLECLGLNIVEDK